MEKRHDLLTINIDVNATKAESRHACSQLTKMSKWETTLIVDTLTQ